MLHYFASLRIFKEPKISFRILAYPFENQPWDKMMAVAKTESSRRFKMVACHNMGVPHFYMNFFLGKDEAHIHPQPDIIVANGTKWKNILDGAGFSCAVRNGGSIRFQIHSTKDEESTFCAYERKKNVLVLLSTSLNYSLDLLFYLIRAADPQKTFFIKTHPDTPEKIIRKYIKYFPQNFSFVGGTMEEWMGKVDWAIHVGTTAAIECMMKGISVIKFLPERIDLDPILGLEIDQQVVTDGVRNIFQANGNPNRLDGSLIAEPFNEKIWNDILGSKDKYGF